MKLKGIYATKELFLDGKKVVCTCCGKDKFEWGYFSLDMAETAVSLMSNISPKFGKWIKKNKIRGICNYTNIINEMSALHLSLLPQGDFEVDIPEKFIIDEPVKYITNKDIDIESAKQLLKNAEPVNSEIQKTLANIQKQLEEKGLINMEKANDIAIKVIDMINKETINNLEAGCVVGIIISKYGIDGFFNKK